MIGPALQGAQFLSNAGRLAPWLLTGATFAPDIVSAFQGLGGGARTATSPGGRRGARPTRTGRKLDPRYTSTGAPIPGALRAGASEAGIRAGGGNAGLSIQPPLGAAPRPLDLPPAERAYQAEKARVSQLTAQDPELQRYEAARKLAAGKEATPEQVQAAEDIGMQIWRDKYGGTPMGQPGGAIGSYNPLMQRTFGYQTGQAPGQIAEMQATAAPVPVAPEGIPYQQGDLGTRATLETGYDPAQYGLSPSLVEEMKARLLQQAAR
jgi:hypothetical protein